MSKSNLPKPSLISSETSHSTSPWLSLSNMVVGLCFGLLLGIAGMIYIPERYPQIAELLHGVYFMAFGAAIFSFIIIFGFRPYVQRFLLNRLPNNTRGVVEDMENVSNYIADQLINKLPEEPPTEIKTRFRAILPGLANMLIWARLRNWWWQWILGIFVAIGGLMGTLLLTRQNDLLNNQNTLIQYQMNLEEASRRGSLVVLMSNIMDKVDAEILEQRNLLPHAQRESAQFNLSSSLIGQIAALSHSFKPYRYLDGGDSLISNPLSPERGQLLITLTLLPLDSISLQKIYLSSTFESADLKNAILSGANLNRANLNLANLSGAILHGANLSSAYLPGADLSGAKFGNADFKEANLNTANLSEAMLFNSNFTGASLLGTNFRAAHLFGADFTLANLNFADFSSATLSGSNFSNSDLRGAIFNEANFGEIVYHPNPAIEMHFNGGNFSGANLSETDFRKASLNQATIVTAEQLSHAYSLYLTNLSEPLKTSLLQTHPQLFKKPIEIKN